MILTRKRLAAFTLIELSLVVVVLALLAGFAMRAKTASLDSNNYAELNSRLDVVQTALQNYRTINGRLPCPTGIDLTENNSSFGTEYDASPGSGNCTLGNGTVYVNSATDPDASDPNYDSATANKIVEGGIPTRALKLADKYAYDPWGRKIFYVVDARITASLAFTTYPIYNTAIGGVVIKRVAGADTTLANALTYKAVYALISMGKSGHGGYVRNVSTWSTRYNGNVTNANVLVNCHCDASANATTFNRIFMYGGSNNDSAYATGSSVFDNIVRFKTRAQMATYSELQ